MFPTLFPNIKYLPKNMQYPRVGNAVCIIILTAAVLYFGGWFSGGVTVIAAFVLGTLVNYLEIFFFSWLINRQLAKIKGCKTVAAKTHSENLFT